jgi:hypothetical protein
MTGGRRSGGSRTATLTGSGVSYDPNCPVAVELRFDSPHVVTYHIWIALPNGPLQKVASGTDEDLTTISGHRHVLGPYPAATKISYMVLFTGNPGTSYKAQLAVTQDGQMIEGGLVTIQGHTNQDGAAVARGEVVL